MSLERARISCWKYSSQRFYEPKYSVHNIRPGPKHYNRNGFGTLYHHVWVLGPSGSVLSNFMAPVVWLVSEVVSAETLPGLQVPKRDVF